MSDLYLLEEESRMSVACLLRDIIQNNPPLNHLNFDGFSSNKAGNAGEIILEALLNSSISTIQHLDLACNESWFSHGKTDREGAVEMLTEVISNMKSSLQKLNLR